MYIISVAAELAGVHPQTLRMYERKGLLAPKRTSGNTRRYSEADIERIRAIQELTQLGGISLSGVKLFIEMREQLAEMQRRAAELERELRRRAQARRDGPTEIVPLHSVTRFTWEEALVTIELRGPAVTLRAFQPEEYDEMIARLLGRSPADDEEARMRRTRVERSGTRTEIELLFAVESDGRLVGDAQARSLRMAMPFGVWEIGIELWDTGDRGRGLGREAVALLTSRLFEQEGAHRVQARTDVENAAMRRVLEALGFTDEGRCAGSCRPVTDAPRDYELYGVTVTDWMRNDRWIRTS